MGHTLDARSDSAAGRSGQPVQPTLATPNGNAPLLSQPTGGVLHRCTSCLSGSVDLGPRLSA